ncbi:MAG TPA: DUF3300 domain-containing protein [Gammaproteobacteria bacterium]|nr:DUF3300 domain-containing protein [Gammaproteobacteria bacterium]
MNNLHMRAALTLGLLALAAGPAHAEEYVVEPIVDDVVTTSADGQEYTQAQLDQLLAPIALYPDSLLSQVLVAATYPLEVVEAARWSRQNPQLEGENAVAAVADRDWDPSVKALVAFPEILARMDEDLDWTRNLGDAMLYQEAQVMDSIQFLRARADAEGNLETTEYARVIREEKTIIIEPARTHVVHVPYYDPYVVYGSWWWPAYPPVVWAAPSYYYHGHPGYYWGSGIRLSSGFFFSSFYWPQRSVVILHAPRYYHAPRYRSARHYYTPGERWKHNPRHRRGVAYRHKDVRQRYDQPRLKAGPSTRWPIEHRGTRATGSADRDSRLAGTRRDYREDRDGAWRDRNSRVSRDSRVARPADRASGSVREAADRSQRQVTNRTARDTDGARLSAGPRTVQPSVSRTGERLRDTRASTRPQQRAQRTVAPTQRPATVTRRAVSPSQRTASAPRAGASTPRAGASTSRARSSAPRAAAPAARSTVSSSPRSTSRAPQSRPQGRSSAPAATAPAPRARAESRSSSRDTESRAAPRAERDKGKANSWRGQAGRNGRRFD